MPLTLGPVAWPLSALFASLVVVASCWLCLFLLRPRFLRDFVVFVPLWFSLGPDWTAPSLLCDSELGWVPSVTFAVPCCCCCCCRLGFALFFAPPRFLRRLAVAPGVLEESVTLLVALDPSPAVAADDARFGFELLTERLAVFETWFGVSLACMLFVSTCCLTNSVATVLLASNATIE